MKFCPECGTRMRPQPTLTGRVFVCAKCDARIHEEQQVQGADHQDESEYTDDGHQSSTERATSLDVSPDEIEVMTEGEQVYIQRLYEYAEQHYPNFMDYASECPDHLEGLKPEFRYKQVLVWFVTEKILPSIGKTVLEEFVEKYVANEDPQAAARMLQMKDVIRGSFRILDSSHLPFVPVEQVETGKRYAAVFRGEAAHSQFRAGDVVISKIHPWRDECYIFDGIIVRSMSDEDLMRRLGLVSPAVMMEWYEKQELNRYESTLVSRSTTLHAAMNKYPAGWVDCISMALGIDVRGKKKDEKAKLASLQLESGSADELLERKIPVSSVEALKLLKEMGWVMKYGQLTRRFSSQVGLWWNEKPPNTDLGLLRLHGLLVVGRMPSGGRLYKAAVVPAESRTSAERLISKLSST